MVDYSKWKNIEISDDEDDIHPNVDTPSLFRWRHQARVERMEEQDRKVKEVKTVKQLHDAKLKEVKEAIGKCKEETQVQTLQKQLKDLEVKSKEIAEKEQILKAEEKKTPWNIDTISKPGFAKTVINKKPEPVSYDKLSDDEKERRMRDFVKENEKLLKQFGMLRKFEDSRLFLLDNHHLVGEATANYLVIWCINLEMEKKTELMSHVAHQCICMQFILELAKQLDVDPRACVGSFFQRIQVAEAEYKAHFDSEVKAFKDRIQKRALEKIEEALAEQEEEERQARLGPGGLDPVEVFESLPEVLQKCFESRDIGALQEAITKFPEDEAKYHMKRCVESGLWVPEANKDKAEEPSDKPEEVTATAKPSVSTDDVD